MFALALAAALAPGLIDPAVVDLLVAHKEWSDSYPTFARAFVEYGDDAAALALLDRWTPPRNPELYEWHKAARNARGMIGAISYPYRPVSRPILELMFHQDDVHIKKAVAFVRAADERREQLNLGGQYARDSLKLLPTDTQLVDLCYLLSNSEHKELAATIFKRYLAPVYGGDTEVAKYLGFVATDSSDLSAYFPSGVGVLSTDDLVMFASRRDSGLYDDAVLSALLSGARWGAGYHRGNMGGTHLYPVLQRLDETGQRRDVLKVVDRYIDVIDDWIVADPLYARYHWAPLLVTIGRPAPLVAAAQSVWTLARPAYEDQVAKTPEAVNSRQIETVAILFALGGDTARAREALELMQRAPKSAPSTTLAELESQRLALQGKYEEAFVVLIPEGRYRMDALVRACREAIRHSVNESDKRRIARRIASEMLTFAVFDSWTEIGETLLSLGLKSELRSILDAVCSSPYQNEREYDDVFRCYFALGERATAKRFAFPHEIRATWLLELLYEWDDLIHGSKSDLRDVDGRDVIEEGLRGFREIVPDHPFWISNFAPLLESFKLNKPLTDRAIVELRVCLALLSDDLAQEMSLELLKEMLASQPSTLPLKSTQRDVAAAISDRLRNSRGGP
ncbi:MAG: hypothetical protein WD716_13335 [Fimbriimonadaceae bacterium]